MTKTITKTVTSKSGTVINEGERVTVAFDLKTKSGESFAGGFSMRTDDGRKINTRNPATIGIKTPSLKKLERWSDDGIAETVFGDRTEPDGWTEGAPSWLLFLGLI